MGAFVDITGCKYGRLTVLRLAERLYGRVTWLCKCECGTEIAVISNSLRRGGTKSCGCFQRETIAAIRTSHGHTRNGGWTPEYRSWSGMVQRCTDPAQLHYHSYGGRGITVCERWLKFDNFFADMGRKPSPKHSIDRIDVNGNYEPGNCRWATAIEQANNARTNRWLDLPDGRRLTLSQRARELDIPVTTLWHRLKKVA